MIELGLIQFCIIHISATMKTVQVGRFLTLFVVVSLVTIASCQKLPLSRYQASYSPVVFIPGDGGSQLQAKLDKSTQVHHVCEKKSDWYNIWINFHLLTPVAFDCLVDNMQLHYDAQTHKSSQTEGVDIRPNNFGSLASVSYLDAARVPKTDYFENIIATLEQNNGLVREVDMVGAPYDFRKAPNELGEFIANLTRLIEDSYAIHNYRPVTLICHSMGCLNSQLLLNSKSQEWRDVHIKRMIALAAPWSGSFKALTSLMFGDTFGIPLPKSLQKKLQQLQCTFPSMTYLFPRKPTFDASQVIVETASRNFTLDNLNDMFKFVNMSDQAAMWRDTMSIAHNLTAPKVELWCLFGTGVQTPTKLYIEGPYENRKYSLDFGDGDGSVNVESLRACLEFSKQQSQPVHIREFNDTNHIGILRKKDPALYISSQIMANDSKLIRTHRNRRN